MARPKSMEKRTAILDAATRVIVAQGLGAPTAVIAKEAGVSNGSLFTYFETKSELFNVLYLELKTGMAQAALSGMPKKATLRDRVFHVWSRWMKWATANPEKRRALAQLSVSDQITPETRAAVQEAVADFVDMLEQIRGAGALKNAPMAFVGALMNALAETTMDFMIRDPEHATQQCTEGFETFWRAIS